jgi:hypothetical protein
MILEDFIEIIDKKKLESLIVSKGLGKIELSEIVIYLYDSLDLSSEIELLTIKETDDQLVFEKANRKLFALFNIEHIVEELYYTLRLNTFSDNKEKASRLIEYAINDA